MSKQALLGIAAIAVIGAGSYGAYKLLKKEGNGPGPGNGNCETRPGHLINIDQVTPVSQGGGDLFWRFDCSYRNESCENQTFVIIMQVKDSNGKTIALQFREMTLIPDQAAGFEWLFIFLESERVLGQNEVEFFVWRSEAEPIILGNSVKIII